MRIFRWYWLVIIFIITGLGCGNSSLHAAKINQPVAQKTVPSNIVAKGIILIDLEGAPVNLSRYIGKPVILFFWTTWCPYCRDELKILNRQAALMAKEGIVVIGVNLSESQSKVQRFFKGYWLNFKMLLDKNGLLADKYDLMGVPTYVFLNKEGKEISQAHSFPLNYRDLLLK